MKNKMFFLLLLFLGFTYVKSQENCNYTLSGYIIDEHDGSKLSFSSISIIGENRGVSANIDGQFELKDLCSKTYQLRISHIGCQPDTVLIKMDESKIQNFFLEHHLEVLNEVQIFDNSKNNNIQQSEISKEILAAATGKPLGEILSAINGVNSLKTGANISKPVIGGFKNNRVQFINQGIQLQSQQWGDEHAPEIDPFAASSYTVIKGAGSVKYTGGALGGLVIIDPKVLPKNSGLNGELNTLYSSNNRLYNTSLMLEGKSKFLPQFAWRIQGSYKRSGNIKTPNYYQKNTGVKELNASADLGYTWKTWYARFFYSQFNSEIGIFSGAHIGNLTDLQNAINRREPRLDDQEGFSYTIKRPMQNIIHELAKFELSYYPMNLGKINFKFARQFNIREEFDKELPRNAYLASLNIPEFSLSLESYSSNLNWEFPEINNLTSELGVALVHQVNTINSFTDFIPDFDQNIYSLYLLEKWQKSNLGLELGLRIDRNDLSVNKLINRLYKQFNNSFNSITLNIGFNYLLKNKQQFKGNLTYTERPPAINELYSSGLHHGSASLEFGNPALGKEKSSSLDFSYQVSNKKWNYELYAYIRYVQDFIYLNPNGLDLTIRGAYPSYEWTNTTALIRGFDQTITYKLDQHFTIKNAASYLWANNIDADNYLINMPSNRIESSISYESIQAKKQGKITGNIGHQVVFKQNRYNEEQEFAAPPKTYHLFFAGLGFKTKLREKHNLEISLRAENLLNEVYRDYLNRFRFYVDEQGRNITIRLKFNF